MIQSLKMIIFALLIVSCGSKQQVQLVDSIEVNLQTANDVNPNEKGQANPVRVTIYQLNQSDGFDRSDYFALSEESDPELNAQIHKFYDVIMYPGEEKKLTVLVKRNVTALGIVTSYRDIEQAEWKTVYLLPKKPKESWYKNVWSTEYSDQEKIIVNIDRLSTSIKKMD